MVEAADPSADGPRGAARFLHVNYNVGDGPAVMEFYRRVAGLNAAMHSPPEPSPGEVLAIDRPMVTAETLFGYDRRGPRSSPAVEIVQWLDPPTDGTVYDRPNQPGLHALIFTVESLDATRAEVGAAGGTVLGEAPASLLGDDRPTLAVRDPEGSPVLFVPQEPADTGLGASLAAGLWLSCADIETTSSWYRRIGFTELEHPTPRRLPAAAFGVDGTVFGVNRTRRDARLDLDANGTVEVVTSRLALAEDTPPFQLCLVQWVRPARSGDAYPNANHRGMFRMALRVEDVDAACAYTTGQGVSARGPLWVPLPGTGIGELHIAFLTDPDGVVVEFVERAATFFRPPRAVPV